MIKPIQNHSCAKCGSPAQKQFSISYGKTLKETNAWGQDKEKRRIVGQETGYICNTCIIHERWRTIKGLTLLFFVLLIIGIAAFTVIFKEPIIGIAMGASASVILMSISLIIAFIGKPMGSYVLLEVHRNRLKSQGYDVIVPGGHVNTEIDAPESKNTMMPSQQNKVAEDLSMDSCRICKGEVVQQYSFYYGTRKSITVKKTFKRETYTSTYSVGGTHTGGICDECVKNRIKGHMTISIFGFIMFTVITIVWIKTSSNTQRDLLPFIFAGTVAIVFAAFAYSRFMDLRRHNYQQDGSVLLIKAEKEKYQLQGYDTFWTPN